MRTLKVKITSSVSSKLRDKRIEIDPEFCKSYNVVEFKEATAEMETPDAYLIVPKRGGFSSGQWISKDMITVLPDVKDSLDRWA